MSLSRFHPLVQQWFTASVGAPTAAQARGWEHIADGRHTLIAAPTGSGKTLAAFLTAIDRLTRDGLAAPLPREVRVLYVSPLKALSADIHKNLAEPRRGIVERAVAAGFLPARGTPAGRSGALAAGRDHRGGSTRRHVSGRTGRHDPASAAHPRHHPGIALSLADL